MSTLEGLLQRSEGAWLVTGAAGFIGSHLVSRLLAAGQTVIGLDNFVTGHRRNLPGPAKGFQFIEGDITDLPTCKRAMEGVAYVLHQAALGSVPRSIKDPLATHRANVDGFVNLLSAAKESKARRFVYASSSSVYGDDPRLPKQEDQTGRVLSPYAATKAVDEIYARVFERSYGLETVGLRYFNVFGPRQDPEGPYAAVIPRWMAALTAGQPCELYGDGETSRDFCYVANAVQANIRAALMIGAKVTDTVYNVAVGGRTTLRQLYYLLRDEIAQRRPHAAKAEPTFMAERSGDIRHSQADISRAKERLGYEPSHTVAQGIAETVEAFFEAGAR